MKGYIYKIFGMGKFYIGSTSLTPQARLLEHKSASTKPNNAKYPIYAHFLSVGWECATLETLRECEYSTKKDLLKYEREEIDKVLHDPNCLNKNRPIITSEELKQQVKENTVKWQYENKERCQYNLREWRKNNPEKVKEQRLKRHAKTKQEQCEWYLQNKEKKRIQVQQWRINNPEKYAQQKKRSTEQQLFKRRSKKKIEESI